MSNKTTSLYFYDARPIHETLSPSIAEKKRPGDHSLFLALIFLSLSFSISVLFFMPMQPAYAETIIVNGTNVAAIQNAIDGATDGDVIQVSAGTYGGSSTINIDVGILLLGPNAGVSGNDDSRTDEAVISINNPAGPAIRIATAAPVTIDGFTFDGTGGPIDAAAVGSNPSIQNNIFKNASMMFFAAPGTFVFENNYLTDIIAVGGNTDALFIAGNWDGTTGTQVTIQNNIWEDSTTSGINLSNVRGDVSNNTFNNMIYYGILIANSPGTLTITDNVFDGITNPNPDPVTGSTTWGAGVRFFDPAGDGPVTITDNAFSDSYVGIGVRPSNSIADMNVEISSNTFSNNTANIRNEGNGAMNVANNYWGTAVEATIDAKIDGAGGDLVIHAPWYVDEVLSILSTTIPTTTYVDATYIDGNAGENIFGYDAFDTISDAIDGTESGGTINVAPGTYNESVTIDKSISLLGANAGVNPLTGSRGEETIITSAGTALRVHATDVIVDGFTITSTAEISLTTHEVASLISGLTVQNNIITGPTRALTVHSGSVDASSGVLILNNDLVSNTRSLHVSGGSFVDLKVNGNRFSGPVAATGVQFLGPGVPIDGFEFMDNEVLHTANIGSNITNATVSGNIFASVSGSLNVQMNLHNSTVTDNDFEGNDARACFQLFGSQFGLVPSSNVIISENRFNNCNTYGIQLSPDITGITIENNTFTNSFDAINTRSVLDDSTGAFISTWDVTGKNIVITGNSITGTTNKGVNNTQVGTLDATLNYWGSATGPFHATDNPSGTGDSVSDNVEFKPYYIDAAMTTESSDSQVAADDEVELEPDSPEVVIPEDLDETTITVPSTVTDATVNVAALVTSSDGIKNATLPKLNINVNTTVGEIQIAIPNGTQITADDAWDGSINVPTIRSTDSVTVTPSDDDVEVDEVLTVIEIGFDDVVLDFDTGVRIMIPDMAGNLVGYSRAGTFTPITNACTADTQAAGDALPAGGDCKIDAGDDLVVWTKHFTSFVVYSEAPVASDDEDDDGGSSGGGGGGGSRTVSITWPHSVTTFTESYFEENPLDRIQVSASAFLNAGGISINTANVGQQLSISGTFTNYQQVSQDYAFIVQVTDQNGFVTDIAWQQGIVESGNAVEISTLWTPENAGIHTVQIFVWDGISTTPLPLSGVTVKGIAVTE